MSKHKHYVPILKGRRGEFPALKAIRDKAAVTPLLEAVPKFECEYIASNMTKAWGKDHPFLIDFLHYPDEHEDRGGTKAHPITHCFKVVASAGLLAIPVTGTGRSPEYQKAVKRIAASARRGVVIRLTPLDFDDETDLKGALDALIEFVGVKRDEVDIIIDLESVASTETASVAAMFRANISLLPNLAEWRTLTVAAAAFPLGLGPLDRDTWNPWPRRDWLGWQSLVTGAKKPDRLPAYGDYGIAHPGVPPTGRATTLAQLRYATPSLWLIWKGGNVLKHPRKYKQFFDICKKMVARPECKPATFSVGDKLIHEKAASVGLSGNAETWRTIALNHHAEMVISQLASLP
jgi:hypothetical protein